MIKIQNIKYLFGSLEFWIWCLFDYWCLGVRIFTL